MTDLSAFFSETVDSRGGTYRWMSPELLDPEGCHSDGRFTLQSDCYALGMVIYEVSVVALIVMSPRLHIPGSDWPQTIPRYAWYHICWACSKR